MQTRLAGLFLRFKKSDFAKELMMYFVVFGAIFIWDLVENRPSFNEASYTLAMYLGYTLVFSVASYLISKGMQARREIRLITLIVCWGLVVGFAAEIDYQIFVVGKPASLLMYILAIGFNLIALYAPFAIWKEIKGK